jgi:predicted enzyme related to lactoylglutathione lyase
MAPQPIVHIDFPAHDPAALSAFYADLFGWKITSYPEFDYYTFSGEPGQSPGGGFPRIGGEYNYQAGEVVVYINSDDIDADLARIAAAGGKALSPKIDIGGNQGYYAFFQDPSGNRVALYTSGTPTAVA